MFRVAAIAACLAAVAGAATLRQLTVDQMASSATAIVKARVLSSSAAATGNTIYTHYRLRIDEQWKGAPVEEVMLPGGTAGGFRETAPGVPRLKSGTEYLMFLWTSPSTGITHLIGLTQGLFSLSAQADGSFLASRDRIGETMLDATGAQVNDQAIRMNLNDMKAQVARSLGRAQAAR